MPSNLRIINDVPRGNFRHALFDFDGTISLLREGWQGIMAPVCIEMICGGNPPTPEVEAAVERMIDETTGNVWMTGVCLKPLGTARREGTRWRAELSEMVSVGRGRTLLEQAFLLETAADAPAITVSNPARGGDQAISGVVRIDCGSGDHCQRAAASPAC